MAALQICMLVLPFVELCREKEGYLAKLLEPLNRREPLQESSQCISSKSTWQSGH